MSWTRAIPRALRVAAMWLSMVCAVFVQTWSGALPGFEHASCPCDDAADHHADEGSGHTEHAAGEDADHDDPCHDECPGDCANCGCCATVATALPPLSLPTAAIAFVELARFTPAASPASGVNTNVFRPPRAPT